MSVFSKVLETFHVHLYQINPVAKLLTRQVYVLVQSPLPPSLSSVALEVKRSKSLQFPTQNATLPPPPFLAAAATTGAKFAAAVKLPTRRIAAAEGILRLCTKLTHSTPLGRSVGCNSGAVLAALLNDHFTFRLFSRSVSRSGIWKPEMALPASLGTTG